MSSPTLAAWPSAWIASRWRSSPITAWIWSLARFCAPGARSVTLGWRPRTLLNRLLDAARSKGPAVSREARRHDSTQCAGALDRAATRGTHSAPELLRSSRGVAAVDQFELPGPGGRSESGRTPPLARISASSCRDGLLSRWRARRRQPRYHDPYMPLAEQCEPLPAALGGLPARAGAPLSGGGEDGCAALRMDRGARG
jgi:hypothetical protein